MLGIRRREPTESSSVTGTIQDRHLQILKREFLIPDLVEGGDTERESHLQIRRLREPFLLEQGLNSLGFSSDYRKGALVDDAPVE